MTVVVGVDARPKGWVAVALRGERVEVTSDRDLITLVGRYGDAEVVAIDMPIGFESPERACDRAAKEMLGKRRNSVFMTPPRDILEHEGYAEANEYSKRHHHRGISRQAHALRANILLVAGLVAEDKRLIEVHPEVSFTALNHHEPLGLAKTTWNGQAARRALLAKEGIGLPERLDGDAGAVPPPDILDAAVAAWSAGRFAVGDAASLPAGAGRSGRPVIWF